MTATHDHHEPADTITGPVNTTAPADPFDDLYGYYIHALEAVDDVARKAEAAGVLYGEPLYRELSIGLAAVRGPLVEMRHAANRGRHQRDDRIRELLAAVDQWATDYNRTTGTLDALAVRIEELEAELAIDEPPPLGGPSERAHGLIGILRTMNLNPDEAAHIIAALRNPATAAPPAEPYVADAAEQWETVAAQLGLPITPRQADGILAARSPRGLPHGPGSDTAGNIRAWLEWARAGFPETPTPETIATRPHITGDVVVEPGQ